MSRLRKTALIGFGVSLIVMAKNAENTITFYVCLVASAIFVFMFTASFFKG